MSRGSPGAKPTHPSWRDWLRSSFLDQVVRLSGDIEVHVLAGELPRRASSAAERDKPRRRRFEPAGFAAAVVSVCATTAVGRLSFVGPQLADVVMLYLLGIVLVS